jgi:hypothetical protein
MARSAIKEKFLSDEEYTPTKEQLKVFEVDSKKTIDKFIDEWWIKFHERSKVIIKNQNISDEEAEELENDVSETELADELNDEETEGLAINVIDGV